MSAEKFIDLFSFSYFCCRTFSFHQCFASGLIPVWILTRVLDDQRSIISTVRIQFILLKQNLLLIGLHEGLLTSRRSLQASSKTSGSSKIQFFFFLWGSFCLPKFWSDPVRIWTRIQIRIWSNLLLAVFDWHFRRIRFLESVHWITNPDPGSYRYSFRHNVQYSFRNWGIRFQIRIRTNNLWFGSRS